MFESIEISIVVEVEAEAEAEFVEFATVGAILDCLRVITRIEIKTLNL